MAKKYKAKYTGNVYNSKAEAIADNKRYFSDVNYRYDVKSRKVKQSKGYTIPFIKDKRISLTNAGLATGAVISENLLDSIAKHANAAGLPIKTALGLAVKESTLGNPTDDRSVYKILKPEWAKWFKEQGTGQHINTKGEDIDPYMLVNFYKGDMNPYRETRVYAQTKSANGKTFNWDTYYDLLEKGENYADSKVKAFEQNYGDKNVLYNAFKFYKEHPDKYNPGQPNYQQLVNKRADEVWNSPEIQSWYKRSLEDGRTQKKEGGIHIAPSKRGTFTAAATKHGMGVQEFASRVLRNKDSYSPAMVKKANFARNASKWNH